MKLLEPPHSSMRWLLRCGGVRLGAARRIVTTIGPASPGGWFSCCTLEVYVPKLESHLRSLSARSLSWVLTGRMTLDEARYLDAHPGLTDDQVEGCMRRRHGKHHERFVELAPGIDRPIEDLDALLIEAWDLPSELLEAFTAGSLTFIDARYAARRLSVRSRRQFIGIQISLIEDLECQQVLNEMERDPRVPRDLIAGYRVTPINARYLRLYFGAITGAPVPAPLA